MLEKSNPFQKAQELLNAMKSHKAGQLTDTTSDSQSILTEDVASSDVWSFGNPTETIGSDEEMDNDGRWPKFDDNASIKDLSKSPTPRIEVSVSFF